VKRALTVVPAALVALGLTVSGYVLWVKESDGTIACPTGGCERVQHSAFAELHSVPLPALGLVLYLALAYLLWRPGITHRTAEAALALAGAAFSVYLVGVQMFTLIAYCAWCLVSDTALVLLAGFAFVRLFVACREARQAEIEALPALTPLRG